MALNFASNEPQNPAIDGAGNAASNPMHCFGTIPPPQLPVPTRPRPSGNYDSALRDRPHSATDVQSPHRPCSPMQQITPTLLPFTFPGSSHVPSFLENSLTAPPRASTNCDPETSSYDHPSYPIHPRLAPNERIDDLYNETSVSLLQAAMPQNAPPVLPSILQGVGKRFVDALPWLNTGTERDGVVLIERTAQQLGLQIHIVRVPPPAPWAPPQPFPNSSTIYASPTLPELGGAGIGHSAEIPMSYAAQMNNPYPDHITAEQPQRFPGLSITHAQSFPLSESSATSPHGNCGLRPPSSSPRLNHRATPAFHRGTAPISLEPIPPAKISPTLPPILHCGPGHELQPFQREHDANPSSSTQSAFGSGAPIGQNHAAGHGQFPAFPAGAANTVDTASRVRKPGRCSQCTTADTPQWRRHPDTKLRLCNGCGQKAYKKGNKNKNGMDTPGRKRQPRR